MNERQKRIKNMHKLKKNVCYRVVGETDLEEKMFSESEKFF